MIHKCLEIFIIWDKGRFKVASIFFNIILTKKAEVILEVLFSVFESTVVIKNAENLKDTRYFILKTLICDFL